MKCTCYDCAHCASRDVFVGYCEKKDESVVIDNEIECADFETKEKCKNCVHYTETEAYLGVCCGKSPTYPDLLACANYKRA